MSVADIKNVEDLMKVLDSRDGEQSEFLQAAGEVFESLRPVFEKRPELLAVAARLSEPERVIMFRVPWQDDKGNWQVNRGFRVQFSSTLGPYKGGLRFHPSVNLSIIKFLGFEQIFKNCLTGLPLGGGKGGSDFDPKGRSDAEVMRFCQSFMTELQRHIGADTDVPAGDIGVGAREVGFMFGQYKRLRNAFEGALTGKSPAWGGSLLRPEATGYGVVYFAQRIFHEYMKTELTGKRVLVSGSGNVAQYCSEKLLELGAHVLTLSDSSGTLSFAGQDTGLTSEQLSAVLVLKNEKRGRLSDLVGDELFAKATYHAGTKPWSLELTADAAMPCATQNEVLHADADALIKAGVRVFVEGSNMSSTDEAIAALKAGGVYFAPSKAANAGGVAVSGLEMSQNSQRLAWTREEVDAKLNGIMNNIFDQCAAAAERYEMKGDLQAGANIAAFEILADAMLQQGCV